MYNKKELGKLWEQINHILKLQFDGVVDIESLPDPRTSQLYRFQQILDSPDLDGSLKDRIDWSLFAQSCPIYPQDKLNDPIDAGYLDTHIYREIHELTMDNLRKSSVILDNFCVPPPPRPDEKPPVAVQTTEAADSVETLKKATAENAQKQDENEKQPDPSQSADETEPTAGIFAEDRDQEDMGETQGGGIFADAAELEEESSEDVSGIFAEAKDDDNEQNNTGTSSIFDKVDTDSGKLEGESEARDSISDVESRSDNSEAGQSEPDRIESDREENKEDQSTEKIDNISDGQVDDDF